MTPHLLRRIYGSIILTLCIWAFVHYALVRIFHVNPWKLYGMAMYLQDVGLDIALYDEIDGNKQIFMLGELPQAVQDEVMDNLTDLKTLGLLYRPNELAKSLLAARPQAEAIVIKVITDRLDPWTGLEEKQEHSYRYER